MSTDYRDIIFGFEVLFTFLAMVMFLRGLNYLCVCVDILLLCNLQWNSLMRVLIGVNGAQFSRLEIIGHFEVEQGIGSSCKLTKLRNKYYHKKHHVKVSGVTESVVLFRWIMTSSAEHSNLVQTPYKHL